MNVYGLHLASCLFLTGLIWVVQIVHYPCFRFVSAERFLEFNHFHQNAITYVVAPAMIFELVTGLVLLSQNLSDGRFWGLFVFMALIWLSTFFLSVPLHNKLVSNGLDLAVIDRLVLTNWPRTLLWTLRSILLIYLWESFK